MPMVDPTRHWESGNALRRHSTTIARRNAFTPYATLKDALGVGVFMIVYAWFVFYIPTYLRRRQLQHRPIPW